MEKQLFDWLEWDPGDLSMLQFYDCTLKVAIGAFDIGSKVPTIVMDYDKGTLAVYDKQGWFTARHKLKLTVEED